jgi:hypothetical protein
MAAPAAGGQSTDGCGMCWLCRVVLAGRDKVVLQIMIVNFACGRGRRRAGPCMCSVPQDAYSQKPKWLTCAHHSDQALDLQEHHINTRHCVQYISQQCSARSAQWLLHANCAKGECRNFFQQLLQAYRRAYHLLCQHEVQLCVGLPGC